MTFQLREILLLLICQPHRLAAAFWWHLCGKRVRARNYLQRAIAKLPFAYERGIQMAGADDLATIRSASCADWPGGKPSTAICVYLHIALDDEPAAAKRAAASALRQSIMPVKVFVATAGAPEAWVSRPEIEIVAGAEGGRIAGLHQALSRARSADAAYLVPLAADASLPHHALAAYAAHCVRSLSPDDMLPILYGDQDEAAGGAEGNRPWLKPDWDARMILSQDYVGAACALPVAAALRCLDDTDHPSVQSLYELILRLSLGKAEVPVSHVHRITASTAADHWQRSEPGNTDAIARIIDPRAQTRPGPSGTTSVHWPLPEPAPKVSIVVATRDRAELLRTCVEGLLNATDYPDFEIIIADNDSREAEALEYLAEVTADPRVRVVRWPHRFNYSAINNFAAGFATGQFICLLNNDIEILHADWLTAMVREAVQPGVGAVGARLLYPDRSIQHAGVVIGVGNAAGHAHRGLPEGEPGYFAQALIARGASAVTGACLLVAKHYFDAVGGLDEQDLAVAYNDVDLCLKLRELGLANIYTPAATLIHHESKSRGLDFAPEHLERYLRELAVFQQRWDTTRVVDPWHHPALDRASEVFGGPQGKA